MCSVSSAIDSGDFLNICTSVHSVVFTRAELVETDFKGKLTPLVEDGKCIRDQIVSQAKVNKNLREDIQFYENLSEEELATLSFIYHSIELQGADIDMLEAKISGLSVSQQKKMDQIMSCLSVAVGISSLKELGVKGVVNAITVRQAIIAIGKRFLGYVGLAIMIYDFVDCMGG